MKEKILIQLVIGPDIKILSGRMQGELARHKLKIDAKDNDNLKYEVVIPERIRTFNPSYFLGMFCVSIKDLGIDAFLEKYEFISEKGELKKGIKEDIEEGIEWASEGLEVL